MLFAVFAGGEMMGVVGIFLAVPVAAVVPWWRDGRLTAISTSAVRHVGASAGAAAVAAIVTIAAARRHAMKQPALPARLSLGDRIREFRHDAGQRAGGEPLTAGRTGPATCCCWPARRAVARPSGRHVAARTGGRVLRPGQMRSPEGADAGGGRPAAVR